MRFLRPVLIGSVVGWATGAVLFLLGADIVVVLAAEVVVACLASAAVTLAA